MRKLKFRAWDAERGEMLTVDELRLSVVENAHIFVKGRGWLSAGAGTVMQFTGLLDKDGKEIYECDVVQWLGYEVQAGRQIRPPRVIIVGQGYFPPHEDTWHGIDYITDCYHLQNLIAHGDKSVEVLGNIYEHNHLLKLEES